MNIWRVKSKTGKTIHLTFDREKTFCGRSIGDDWQFIYLLKDRTEALEHVENLCSRCNKVNLEEWEKEFTEDGSESEEEIQPITGGVRVSEIGEESNEGFQPEPVAEQEASGRDGEEVTSTDAEPNAQDSDIKDSEQEPKPVKSAKADKTRGLGTW